MSIDITEYSAMDLTQEKLSELIIEGKSFRIIRVKDITTVVHQVEQAIESTGSTCRVYTEYRASAMTGSLIPTGITQTIGLVSAIGIGVHNLVTFNPDYEIAKNKINRSVTVINKKI